MITFLKPTCVTSQSKLSKFESLHGPKGGSNRVIDPKMVHCKCSFALSGPWNPAIRIPAHIVPDSAAQNSLFGANCRPVYYDSSVLSRLGGNAPGPRNWIRLHDEVHQMERMFPGLGSWNPGADRMKRGDVRPTRAHALGPCLLTLWLALFPCVIACWCRRPFIGLVTTGFGVVSGLYK